MQLDMTMANNLTLFKSALANALVGARGVAGKKVKAIEQIITNLRRKVDLEGELVPSVPQPKNPIDRELESAVEHALAADTDGSKAALINAFQRLAPALPWYSRACPEQPLFEVGHMNAEVLGDKGIERRSDLTVGVTIMAPNLTYPDHHHPPEEIYMVLSQGSWRQGATPWYETGFGGYIYNPPNILHAITSSETPLVAIWCLNSMTAQCR